MARQRTRRPRPEPAVKPPAPPCVSTTMRAAVLAALVGSLSHAGPPGAGAPDPAAKPRTPAAAAAPDPAAKPPSEAPISCVDDGELYDPVALRERVAHLASAELDGREPGSPGDAA